MRTSINQGRIQSLAVMIVVLINNDQTPYLTYYRILGLTPSVNLLNFVVSPEDLRKLTVDVLPALRVNSEQA